MYQFCDFLHDISLFQLVLDPTRGCHVLDLVVTSDPSCVSQLNVCDNLPGTDHDAVSFILSILPSKQRKTHRCLYNYKKADFCKFCETLSSILWEMAESGDIDSWWESWKDLFFAAVNTDISSVRWHRSRMKSWLTATTIKAIRLKHTVYHKMKRSASDSLFKKYRSLRNLVCKLTRRDYRLLVCKLTRRDYRLLVCKLTRRDYRAYAEELSASLHSGQKQFGAG